MAHLEEREGRSRIASLGELKQEICVCRRALGAAAADDVRTYVEAHLPYAKLRKLLNKELSDLQGLLRAEPRPRSRAAAEQQAIVESRACVKEERAAAARTDRRITRFCHLAPIAKPEKAAACDNQRMNKLSMKRKAEEEICRDQPRVAGRTLYVETKGPTLRAADMHTRPAVKSQYKDRKFTYYGEEALRGRTLLVAPDLQGDDVQFVTVSVRGDTADVSRGRRAQPPDEERLLVMFCRFGRGGGEKQPRVRAAHLVYEIDERFVEIATSHEGFATLITGDFANDYHSTLDVDVGDGKWAVHKCAAARPVHSAGIPRAFSNSRPCCVRINSRSLSGSSCTRPSTCRSASACTADTTRKTARR
jgi:hypothetical protein